jgi:hypothetical protein
LRGARLTSLRERAVDKTTTTIQCRKWDSLGPCSAVWDMAARTHPKTFGANDSPMTSRANKQWSCIASCARLSADRGHRHCVACLCVVDIGCHTVYAVCAHHPVLLSTARASEPQGHALLLQRSKVADQHGYYDGAARSWCTWISRQSVATGAGFLVVAPPATCNGSLPHGT